MPIFSLFLSKTIIIFYFIFTMKKYFNLSWEKIFQLNYILTFPLVLFEIIPLFDNPKTIVIIKYVIFLMPKYINYDIFTSHVIFNVKLSIVSEL
jgi:hypothetical protein